MFCQQIKEPRPPESRSFASLSRFPWPIMHFWWSESLSWESSPPQSQTFCRLSPSSPRRLYLPTPAFFPSCTTHLPHPFIERKSTWKCSPFPFNLFQVCALFGETTAHTHSSFLVVTQTHTIGISIAVRWAQGEKNTQKSRNHEVFNEHRAVIPLREQNIIVLSHISVREVWVSASQKSVLSPVGGILFWGHLFGLALAFITASRLNALIQFQHPRQIYYFHFQMSGRSRGSPHGF